MDWRPIAGAGAALALLVGAPSASAATTFGSDVSQTASQGFSGQFTRVQDVLTSPGAQITSPISGVVVRWRLKTNAGTMQPQVRLRIIRPVMGGYMAVVTDATAQNVSAMQALNTY